MLQVPIEVDLNNMDPEQFQDMQNIDWQALADLSANPTTQQAAGQLAWLAGGMMVFIGILLVIFFVLMILNLFNIWHWGTVDNKVYESGGETKKKWFVIFFIVPMVAGIVGIVPFIGWIAAIVFYIYWLVMTLLYFFGVRKKIGRSSTPISRPNQEDKTS